MSDEVVRPPIPAAAERAKAVEFLRTAHAPTYKELAQVIGENPQEGRGRQIILSARRDLEDEGIFFRTLINKGLERRNDTDKNELVGDGIRSVRRKARRLEKAHISIDFGQLKELERLTYAIHGTVVGLLNQAAGTKFNTALKKKVTDGINFEQPDLIKLLKAPKKEKTQRENESKQ
jgi:aryl carrier-like protein